MTHRLHADAVTLRRDARTVSRNLSLAIPEGSFSVIVGPNACGKSTLLAALSRLLAPAEGRVVLDGRDIHSLPGREVARRLGLLPQSALAPDGITVAELVARGRYPHQSFLRQWSPADERAVAAALRATRVDGLAERPLDALSGGQRQRVWIAMVLAQETPLLLLDEPTASLDAASEAQVLRSLLGLRGRRTLLVVTHRPALARQADQVLLLEKGRLRLSGRHADLLVRDDWYAGFVGLAGEESSATAVDR